MKRVGIIGGLSPESTMLYYKGINAGVRARRGGHHSAKIIINSLDFGEVKDFQDRGEWGKVGTLLCVAGVELERAAADVVIMATNTMHMKAVDVEQALTTPFIHLADATADAILAKGLSRIALLGTRVTMERDFYKSRLQDKGLEVLVPDEQGRDDVDRIIYDELCHGVLQAESRARYQEIISDLKDQGAQGVILGCTEIGMLISDGDVDIPCFDTTAIHIDAVLDFIFEGEE